MFLFKLFDFQLYNNKLLWKFLRRNLKQISWRKFSDQLTNEDKKSEWFLWLVLNIIAFLVKVIATSLSEGHHIITQGHSTWPEIPDIATAHARGYLTTWPPHPQRKCMAEMKQNKIQHVLAYREKILRFGRVLESFLGYSDKLVFINKCYWPCFSSMHIFEVWPIQCSTKQRLEISFLHPKQIWSSVADNIIGISQVPRALEEKHRMTYYLTNFHLRCWFLRSAFWF